VKVQNSPGSTPLDEEALRGLIPNLTTQGELNEFEEENISEAILWARSSRTLKKDLISVTGLIKIHQKMFDQTWKWAGAFRTREANIGVAPGSIQNELGALLGNVTYWIQQETYSISPHRETYLKALRVADQTESYKNLLKFAKS